MEFIVRLKGASNKDGQVNPTFDGRAVGTAAVTVRNAVDANDAMRRGAALLNVHPSAVEVETYEWAGWEGDGE